MPKLLVPVLIVCLCHVIWAQAPEATHQKIRAAASERNYLAAIAELEALRSASAEIFAANDYDYLLARMSEKSGDFAAASANYLAVAKRDSVLKQYALWHLSKIAGSTGNLLLERMYLAEMITLYPESLLGSAAKNRLARNFFESRNYDAAIRALNTKTSGDSIGPNRANLALLAESYHRAGNIEMARSTYTRLVSETPNSAQPDDFALAGARGLDLMDGGGENLGKNAPQLTDWEHLRRAQIYQFNRDFTDARLHFNSIIVNHPASGLVPDAIYQIGRGYAQQGNFAEAIRWFERVLEQYAEHPVAKDALLQAASAYTRVGKYREAIFRYQRFINQNPDDERASRSYLNIIDTLRDSREDTEAQQWAIKAQEIFRGAPTEALALFAEARIHLSLSDWPSALTTLEKLRAFSDLSGTNVPGGTSTAEVNFLRAFVLEQLRRYPEAIELYLSIPDGTNEYYGARATERLQLLANDELAHPVIAEKLKALTTGQPHGNADIRRQNIQAALRLTETVEERQKLIDLLRKEYEILPAYSTLPAFELLKLGREEIYKTQRQLPVAVSHQSIADELLFLGLYDEAAPELEAHYKPKPDAPGSSPKPKTDFEYTIAAFYNRGDMASRATAFMEPLWKVPADYQPELIPPNVAAMLYPAPYADQLLKFAPPRNVDPRFLLSIMRQESRFRADVKSYAAARGLMQFISSTSETIAGELGREPFRQDELYDPATAILFGSQYVNNLFKIFPNKPAAVAASYNGGEDNMKRWSARARSDSPDLYVPEIAYAQTKDYVFRVMGNYRMYKMLYDENLKPLR